MAEERLCERTILEEVTKRRAGLRFFLIIRVDKSSGKGKRRLIQDEVRKGEDENKLTKMVGLKQGAWTNWNSTIQRKIKWSEMRNNHAID